MSFRRCQCLDFVSEVRWIVGMFGYVLHVGHSRVESFHHLKPDPDLNENTLSKAERPRMDVDFHVDG